MKRVNACVLGAGFVLGVAGVARAADPPRIVRVYVAGSEEAVSGSRDAVQELCARSNVAVVVHDAAGADGALLSTSNERSLAEAYIDLRPEMPARVVVVDGDTHQELERRDLPQNTTLEISIETAAHIVCAAVDSSLAARVAPAAPRVAEPPASEPKPAALAAPLSPVPRPAVPLVARRPPVDHAAAWQSSIALFAAAEDFGAGFRGGLGGAASFVVGRGALRVGGLITLQGYPSSDVETNAASAGFDSFGARVGPMLEWQASRSASLFAALGIGADRSSLVAHSAAPGTIARATSATTDGVLAALVGVRLQLSRGAGVLLGVDADVALSRHPYVIGTEAGNKPFFLASLVRPVGMLGFSWAFDGPSSAPRELAGARP